LVHKIFIPFPAAVVKNGEMRKWGNGGRGRTVIGLWWIAWKNE